MQYESDRAYFIGRGQAAATATLAWTHSEVQLRHHGIASAEDLPRLHRMLAGQDHWRMRQLAVDLIILNYLSSSYVQDLTIRIEAAVRLAQARPEAPGQTAALGAIHTLRSDLMPPEVCAMLVAAAANRGGLGQQRWTRFRSWHPAFWCSCPRFRHSNPPPRAASMSSQTPALSTASSVIGASFWAAMAVWPPRMV